MAYANQTAIQMAAGGPDRFMSLVDWSNDGVVDADVLAQAQTFADGFIDGYLRVRYTTPIASPTATLVRIAADETVYWLKSARGIAIGPEDIERRKERERELELMRTGALRPDLAQPENPRSAVSAFVSNDVKDVSRASLKGMW